MRTYPTVSTKIPPDLHQWLKDLAQKNSRSVAKQLAWMLSRIKEQGEVQQ